MKILVFNGSPRRNGNTVKMVESFMMAAIEKEHEVVRYDLNRMLVKPCKACDACMKNDGRCVLKDDFRLLSEEIIDADAIVFAAPVYWYTLPAQIKTLVDRFYSYQGKDFRIGEKKVAYLSSCADDDYETFNGFVFALDKTVEFMGWKKVGQVLAKGLEGPDGILKTDYLSDVVRLVSEF